MNNKHKISQKLIAIVVIGLVISSCQKLTRPALPNDYPQDKPVTPTTSLRFFLPFDSTSDAAKQINVRFADSISGYPSFFPDPSTTFVPGATGTAYQGSLSTYLHYYSANDFGSSTNFTISFWLNIMLSQKDHGNADGILAVSSTTNFWSNVCIFADHETSTADSMQLKFVFANGGGNNWDFAGYTGASRWPNMYDGNWHHVAFVYDAGSKTGTLYRDGVQFDQKTNETIAFDGNASQLVVGGFQEAVNIVDTYSNNSWMSGFPGAIDQVRLYNAALAASDIQALYNSKQ
jgi:concanavalin A-like lectin/glucanase superfamily protein